MLLNFMFFVIYINKSGIEIKLFLLVGSFNTNITFWLISSVYDTFVKKAIKLFSVYLYDCAQYRITNALISNGKKCICFEIQLNSLKWIKRTKNVFFFFLLTITHKKSQIHWRTVKMAIIWNETVSLRFLCWLNSIEYIFIIAYQLPICYSNSYIIWTHTE